MKKQASAFILKEEYPLERTAFRAAVFILVCSVGLYGYLVGSSIFNVIAKKEAGLEAARLQTVVGALEKEYFTLAQYVSPKHAEALGLSAVSSTHYVYQSATALSVSARRDL